MFGELMSYINPQVVLSFAAGCGTVLLFIITTTQKASFTYGKLTTTMEEMNRVIQQVRVDVKDLQHTLYKAYMMTPDEARRYLHFHDVEGNVCR